MKKALLAAISLLSLTIASSADIVPSAKPVVTLKQTAISTGDSFTLADIATIVGSKELSPAISNTVIGRSPIEGETRTIGRGDVILKLRQAGIDPSTLSITGSDKVTISVAASTTNYYSQPIGVTTATSNAAQGASASGSAPAASTIAAITPEKPVKVKAGDPVTVTYDDGIVTILLQGNLVSSACVGDRVDVRTTLSTRLISGILVNPGTVKY